MGKGKKKVDVDYSEVIRMIEGWLQYDGWGGVHPYDSHHQAAELMEPGDAWRAMRDIGATLDRVKKQAASDALGG